MTSDSVGLSNPVWKCVSNECEGLNVGLSHNSKRRDPLFPPFQHITKMARVCDALKRQYARVNSNKAFQGPALGPTKVQQDWKLYRMLLLLEAEC